LADHEENVLPALGGRYTAIVTETIEAGALSGTQTAETARRSREVFAELATGGREDHSVLWDHLTAFVSKGIQRLPGWGGSSPHRLLLRRIRSISVVSWAPSRIAPSRRGSPTRKDVRSRPVRDLRW
jgi:hypothetical protein